ncbi:MAG: 50S ribosomal protein L11 methyltransferase, partial [Blastocatellia bacterium]|nr:50S ribosomal protein L11 methyltransferase [Blastocatellia bacterium]
LAEWKKHWKPTEIGRFVIAPPWSEVDERDEQIVIRIEPNMAFGTGTHETTQLCVAAIERKFRDGTTMLDVGTGTGILAIAAARFAASAKIYAFDTDANSVAIARENAKLNGVDSSIELHEGTIEGLKTSFDLVCANLTLDVIIPILDDLIESTRETLILSGILGEQESEIVDELKSRGYPDIEITRKGEWIAVELQKLI